MRLLLLSILMAALAASASAQIETVTPGNQGTNIDGVVVNNTGTANNITLNPDTGSGSSASEVKFSNNSVGNVSGIDANDTVEVAHGANANVSSSEGGTVDYGSGGSGTVTNTAGAGGPSITIKAGGRTSTLAPGNSVTINPPSP